VANIFRKYIVTLDTHCCQRYFLRQLCQHRYAWKKLFCWLAFAGCGTSWAYIDLHVGVAAISNSCSRWRLVGATSALLKQPGEIAQWRCLTAQLPAAYSEVSCAIAHYGASSLCPADTLRERNIAQENHHKTTAHPHNLPLKNTVNFNQGIAQNASPLRSKEDEPPLITLADKPPLPEAGEPTPPPVTSTKVEAPDIPKDIQQKNNPPQLEVQPSQLQSPASAPASVLPYKPDIQGTDELGTLRLRGRKPGNADYLNEELGVLRVRERKKPPSQLETTVPPRFQSVGYLLARVGYFQTSNIFSSLHPVNDSLFWSGLTLTSVPLSLGPKTSVLASVDGYLYRYVNTSRYNYNMVKFNAAIHQQLNQQMYGEIGWSNQKLFTAEKGVRFFDENSLNLTIGRRDALTRKLFLDSLYEFRVSSSDPSSRNRMMNSLWLSLSYYLQPTLQIGLDYQYVLSSFSEQPREDQNHLLLGHLVYGISASSNVSIQGGLGNGSSTDRNINFDSLFFTVNYNLELGQF